MNTTTSNPGGRARAFHLLIETALLSALAFILTNQSAHAGSATWQLDPSFNDWNTAADWTPESVPNGPEDIATFAVSNFTYPAPYSDTEVNGIIFDPGASAFTITLTARGFAPPSLIISGAGITNNSGITQNVVTARGGSVSFYNSATAGDETVFTNTGGEILNPEGDTMFFNSSSAGSGTFINAAAVYSGSPGGGGLTSFTDESSAGNGTFIANGASTANAGPGTIQFDASSTAANGTFTLNGGTASSALGGQLYFNGGTAEQAVLVANGGAGGGSGGATFFNNHSSGDHARIELSGNAQLDISGHALPGVGIGSIEGSGSVLLGGNDLTVGGNNLNTTFQGVISGTGSLIKIGRGKLILGNANTYSRGTTIERGKLVVKNVSGSATGSGPVTVNGGILAGTGIVAGTVTVGTGAGSGALLSPGTKGIGSLTIQRALTLNSDAIYNWGLSSNRVAADEVVANGVTISGAQFSYADVGNSVLPPGTVLTAIDNTAATAISGTFSNLADGGTVVIGSNTFQANYEGGDGDDLTLTVVP